MSTNGDVEAASEITGHLQQNEMAPAASPAHEEVEEQSDEGSEIYEVERILDSKLVRGKRKFLIRWKGYDEDEDSWEPEDNLGGASEIVAAYLKELEANKPKSQKMKATPKSAPRSSKRSTTVLRPEKKDEESDAESDESEDDEFEPTKKKSKKGPHSPKKSDAKETNGKSQLDKAVDRRKNISSNLRWIAESSDESDGDDSVEGQTNKSPDNIHPDSSTDVKAAEKNKSVNDSHETSGSLKLKITMNNDTATLQNGDENGKSDDEEVKAKKNKKTKKANRDEPTPKPSDSSKGTVCFNGVYIDDRDKTMRYVGTNQKTNQMQTYTLSEAYMVDGWSLVRFLQNKINFTSTGEVAVNVESKK